MNMQPCPPNAVSLFIRRTLFQFILLSLPALGTGCHTVPEHTVSRKNAFNTHTRNRIGNLSELLEMTGPHSGQLQTVKFIITDFGDSAKAEVLYMDGRFYALHDEWYWYLRLNGQTAMGQKGVKQGPGCATPAACTDAIRGMAVPPPDLQFVEDRLYSQQFYDWALAKHRKLGLGALMYRAADSASPAMLGFRLEYVDVPTAAQILQFFSMLQQTLPRALASQLVWLPRSPAQIRCAKQMLRQGQLASTQIKYFSDLAREGEAEIYNSGVTVGRLLLVEPDTMETAAAGSDFILVVKTPPDDLPLAAGLISAVPLTALSHLNILAKDRGIPSGYVGGIFDDPWIRQLSDGYAPVALAMRNGTVTVTPISPATYRQFGKRAKPIRLSPAPDYSTSPYVLRISEIISHPRSDWAGLVGGKSSGFEVLHLAVPHAIPGEVAVVTTRAYLEHMAPLRDEVDVLLEHPAFQNSPRVRYYVLEGEQRFNQLFSSHADRRLISDLKQNSPLHYSVGHSGGLKAKIRRQPVPSAILATITQRLNAYFGYLPKTQGLRFRSSSTVEDIDGFNGAGLYESGTGFLNASALPDVRDGKKTVAWALKKTWASYWNFQAFEERRSAGVDHQSGAMGIVVHPVFDDDAELANGVVTFSWNFAGDYVPEKKWQQMRVNTQRGAISVTNPPAGINALPETVDVDAINTGEATVNRVRLAHANGDSYSVLSDTEYQQLFALCRRIADVWNSRMNTASPKFGRYQTITLDLEFKKMSAGWHGFSTAAQPPPSIVIKQVRAIESPPLIPDVFEKGLSAPGDVLLRATRIDRVTCADPLHQIGFYRISSDAKADGAPMGAVSMSGIFMADVTVTVGDRLEVLSPTEYEQPSLDNQVIRFTAAGATRLGMHELQLVNMVCDTKVIAVSDTALLLDMVAQGRVIGRTNQFSGK
ncbi:MAG: hypothetical protein JXX14_22270 [Deltaproteobacteria bacterium]|nr:hypothetical protein [Deltaproteobacteria bacterium]